MQKASPIRTGLLLFSRDLVKRSGFDIHICQIQDGEAR